ncbi:MAG: histidine phosphotransferase [Rhodobiaceae bacterium]|nr:histidine phosphotransferase [Rhodobiaceae bacterium]MCC0014199.1 histidine phosphotransferase [Rhodobiaceae bacterium]MCC0051425.1 histidine phosphotransferase [Rhodobiaceae bacterium]MCC0062411.1 histidine phosphotransferase [Rhodobiaceae bacterium]
MSSATAPGPMELAALLTSKVCHDLISPVGAINNGLEVMADESNADMHDFALDLVTKSAEQASSKLQFCRMAYGAGASAGSEIDLGEAGQVARGFIESDRIKLVWNAPAGALAKDKVKLLLNLVTIAGTIIPRGGEISVGVDTGAGTLDIAARGTNAKIPSGVTDLVAGNVPETGIDAHSIQPYYTSLVAQDAGLSVSFEMGDEACMIAARPS